MKSIYIALVSMVLLSCSKNEEKESVAPPQTTQKENAQTKEDIKFQPKDIVAITSNKKMVKVEGGGYQPFIGGNPDSLVTVKSFLMDEAPVTNVEYLEFLKANPEWTKSKILRIYADSTYLSNWNSDFELPADADPNAPVTNISWFAAKAYAQSVGKRLPTVDEWEYAARASESEKNASTDPEFTNHILALYGKQRGKYKETVKEDAPNYWGLYDMFGKIWEWTVDFNSVMLSGESTGDNVVSAGLYCGGAALTATNLQDYASFLRFAMRGSLHADYTVNNVGFRCAKDLNL